MAQPELATRSPEWRMLPLEAQQAEAQLLEATIDEENRTSPEVETRTTTAAIESAHEQKKEVDDGSDEARTRVCILM